MAPSERATRRSWRRRVVAAAAVAWALSSLTGRAFNTTINVNDFTDPAPVAGACNGANDCSLREAIIKSNATPGNNTINLLAGTYTLSNGPADDDFQFNGAVAETGDLDIENNSLTITGAGSATTTIDATGLGDRIFDVDSPSSGLLAAGLSFTLTGVTLEGGTAPVIPASETMDVPFGETGGAVNFDGTCDNVDTSCTSQGSLMLSDVIITGNTSGGLGGGVYTQFARGITFTNVKFISNSTSMGAGGAFFDLGNVTGTATSGSIVITGSTFMGNSAADTTTGSGGAIRLGPSGSSATVAITDTTFTSNTSGITSGLGGGAISIENARGVTITGGSFANNSAVLGGAIFSNASTATDVVTIAGAELKNNSATGDGGAVFVADGEVRVIGSLVRGNTAANGGGVAAESVVGNPKLTIENSTLSGNLAKNLGGGVFFNNAVTPSGGVATLTNVTLSENRANTSNVGGTAFGGGIARSAGLITLENTIVAGNFRGSAGTTADDANASAGVTSNFSLIQTSTNFVISTGTNNFRGQSAMLGPLQDNGGPFLTYGLLAGSPALDNGSNALAMAPHLAADLTTDQRGTGFARILDSEDPDTTQTVDIGAYEANPSVQVIAPQTTNEDTPITVNFNVGDASAQTITAAVTSSNTGLVPNDAGHIAASVTDSNGAVTLTPIANANGTAMITVTVSAMVNDTAQSMTTSFVLTVNAVNDAPSFTKGPDQTVFEDSGAQSITGWATALSAGPPNESGQTLSFLVAPNNPSLFSVAPAVDTSGNLTFTPAPNANGTSTVSVQIHDNGGTAHGGVDTSAVQTFNIIVVPVNDAPQGTSTTKTLAEDGTYTFAATDFGFSDPADANPPSASGANNFQDVIITTLPALGTLKLSGSPVSVGQAITVANTPNLVFAPAPNGNGTGYTSFTFQVQDDGGTANGGVDTDPSAKTLTFNVAAVADTPVVPVGTTTAINTQTGDMMLDRNAADGTEVTNFKITNIQNGTLFQHDGTTPINAGDFITVAQGQAGVRFTPAANVISPATTFSFDVQGATDNVGGGISPVATAFITVSCDTAAVVSNVLDTGVGSFRDGVARTCPGGAVTFDPTAFAPAGSPYTIPLASGVAVTKNLTITGPSNAVVILAGNNTFRLMQISGASVDVAISNLSFTGGTTQASDNASAIEIDNAGTVTLTNDEIYGNAASGTTTIYAVLSTGLTITNSTLRGNTTHDVLLADRTPVTVTNSTFSDNSGTATAIFTSAVGSSVTNVTVAGNIAGITVDGGLCACAASMTVTNTLLSNLVNLSTASGGTITSGGHNLIDDNTSTQFSAPDPTSIVIAAGTARLAALAVNGGRNQTRALLPGSPALDAGDNTAVATAGLTTDERGTGFARIRDAADADVIQTVDIGAFEADPIVEAIADKTTAEDTPLAAFIFHVGDSTTAFDSIVATSSNTTLVPNANLVIGADTASTRSLTITPAADQNGTSTITVTVTKTVNGVVLTSTDTFTLTVTEVNDAPMAVDDALTSIAEDSGVRTIPVATLLANDAVGPANESAQTLTIISVGTAVGGTVQISGTNVLFTPTANFNGAASFQYTVQDNGTTNGVPDPKTSTATVRFTVTSVADAPTITPTTTNEDTQSTTGLMITRNAVDGADVAFFQITAISNGSVFLNDGTTPVATGAFITAAQGLAGLRFTPTSNFNGAASFVAAGALDAVGTGLGTGTIASITVVSIADAPTITPATTNEDTQSTTGLAIAKNTADGADVTVVKITAITNGSLFLNDGTTPVPTGTFLTFAQAGLGLKFTPAANFNGTASFIAQAALDPSGTGLSVGTTASITVTAVNDAPVAQAVTVPAFNEDSGAHVITLTATDIDSTALTFAIVTNPTKGALGAISAPVCTGAVPTTSCTATVSYTPTLHASGTDTFTYTANDGALDSNTATVSLTITNTDAAPVFTQNPTSQTIAPGGTATFTVAATGSPAPTFQWFVSTNNGGAFSPLANGAPYSGVTTTTLTITPVAAAMTGNQYRAVATNLVTSATSSAATLTSTVAPQITTQPIAQTVISGTTATFTAAASGVPTPTLQWQVSTNGGASFANLSDVAPYSGTLTGTLTITATPATLTGNIYRLVATNVVTSATSVNALLTVNVVPTFTTQPVSQTGNQGANATFTAAVTGTPTPTFGWQNSTDSGTTWTNVTAVAPYSGVTTGTLLITGLTGAQNGQQFRAVATNVAGSTPSTAATLTVNTCGSPQPTSGAWLCVNGGWIDGNNPAYGANLNSVPTVGTTGSTGSTGSTGATGSTGPAVPCTTIQPASDWVCQNGGWLPPNSPLLNGTGTTGSTGATGATGSTGSTGATGSTGSTVCLSPHPTDGTWVCVNGGWVPTNDPFAGGKRDAVVDYVTASGDVVPLTAFGGAHVLFLTPADVDPLVTTQLVSAFDALYDLDAATVSHDAPTSVQFPGLITIAVVDQPCVTTCPAGTLEITPAQFDALSEMMRDSGTVDDAIANAFAALFDAGTTHRPTPSSPAAAVRSAAPMRSSRLRRGVWR